MYVLRLYVYSKIIIRIVYFWTPRYYYNDAVSCIFFLKR